MLTKFFNLERKREDLARLADKLFLLALLFSLIPYYYLYPQLLVTNTFFIARLLFVICNVLYLIGLGFKEFGSTINNKRNLLPLLFFVGISLSVVSSTSMLSFLKGFESFFFTSMVFSSAIFFIKRFEINKRIFDAVIIGALIINIIDELFILFNNQLYIVFANFFLYNSQVEFIQNSISRGRLYVNKFNEVLLPLLSVGMFPFSKKNNIVKFVILALTIIVGLLALLSGWRIRLVVFGVVIFIFLFLLWKMFTIPEIRLSKSNKFALLLCFLLPVVVVLLFKSVSYNRGQSNALDRLLLENVDDSDALFSRLKFIDKAWELFNSSPFFGVGLGHFPLVGGLIYKANTVIPSQVSQVNLLNMGPHNFFLQILSEGGVFAAVPMFLLSVSSMWKDSKYIFKNIIFKLTNTEVNIRRFFFITSFWLTMSFGLLHSQVGFHYYGILFCLYAFKEYY